jgi:quinol monooxygenase YgiN
MGVTLAGTLRCGPEDAVIVRAALAAHIAASRAEPGCLRFEIVETAPGIFTIDEVFVDEAAFVAHTKRTRASDWWRKTGHIPRDLQRRDTRP